MKLGNMITIADIKNLFKKGPCRIRCLDFSGRDKASAKISLKVKLGKTLN